MDITVVFSPRAARMRRLAGPTLFALAAALLLTWAMLAPPTVEGDYTEYVFMLESWANHGSPDLRPGDIASGVPRIRAVRPGYPVDKPYTGYFQSRTGAWFSYHFWAYSLVVLPAKLALREAGGDENVAMQLTNTLIFLAALGVVLAQHGIPLRRRLLFAGMIGASPALWYLRWTGPEVATWACAAVSLVLAHRRRYAAAALVAALGGLQNQPMLFLALFAVGCAIVARAWRAVPLALAATGVSLLPAAFYQAYFGRPNLIASAGGTSASLVSPARTWSFITDLNQGLLPYVPGVVILAALGLAFSAGRRRTVPLGLGVATLAMIVACETTTNWNAGSFGLMRYGLWILPGLAWLASELPATHAWSRATTATIAIQLGIVVALLPSGPSYIRQAPIAALVLRYAPALYTPEPEIFAERVAGAERGDYHELLPAVLSTRDGEVIRVLVDNASLDTLADRYTIDPAYLTEVRRAHAGSAASYYLTPPAGVIRAHPAPPSPPPSPAARR